MGLFGNGMPKRITQEEMKEIMHRLYGRLDDKERLEVEKLFRADLNEPGDEAGISMPEFEAGMQWLRDNGDKHLLEESDIEVVRRYFEQHLVD